MRLMSSSLGLTMLTIMMGCSDRTSSGEGSGDGSGSESGGGDAELETLCQTGCVRYQDCAPDPFASQYGDQATCIDGCITIYEAPSECRSAADPYASCILQLECDAWANLLEDPANTACASQWSDVAASCELP